MLALERPAQAQREALYQRRIVLRRRPAGLCGRRRRGDEQRDLDRRSRERGSYTAVPFPQLYGRSAMWADNHVMVLLKGGTSDARSRHAALAFLKFLYDEGGVWSRTGQLPTRRSVIESPSFTRLPLRSEIASISRDGVALPIEVARQAIIGKMLGDAMIAVIAYGADLDRTLARAETSINRMLKRDAQFKGGVTAAR